MTAAADAIAAPPRRTNAFLWSLRRELWEHRAIYVAPAAMVAVVLAGFLFWSHSVPDLVRKAAVDPKAGEVLNMPFAAAAAASLLISAIVAFFYALGALHGERRDRSILFWKSLPVSDTTTVLAKAAVPVLVQPVVMLLVTFAAHLLMLAWLTVVLAANGLSPGLLFPHLKILLIWTVLPYGLLVNVLWDLPLYGWLFLVSAWARRATFVWAVAPWFALAVFEGIVFRSQNVMALVQSRVFGGFAMAFTVDGQRKTPISGVAQLDPMQLLSSPALWGGLIFAAACFAACIWLRRRQDPV